MTRLALLALSVLLLACSREEVEVAAAAGRSRPLVRLIEDLRAQHVQSSPLSATRPRALLDDGAYLSLRTLDDAAWRLEDIGGPEGGPGAAARLARGGPDAEISRGSGPSFGIRAEHPRNANLVLGPLGVEPSHSYTLAGYVRREGVVAIDGAPSAMLLVEEHDARGGQTWTGSPARVGTADWEFETLGFTTGPEAERILVHACLGANGFASGAVWFDDLLLVDHGPAPTGSAAQLQRTVDAAAAQPWLLDSSTPELGRDEGWHTEGPAAFTAKLRLGDVVRSAVLAPVPTEIALPLQLGQPARLDIDLGVRQLRRLPLDARVDFEISLRPARGPAQVLLRESFAGGEDERWRSRQLDLDAAPEGAQLVLRTTGTPGAQLAPAAWGNPTLTRTPGVPRRPRRILLVSLDTLRADHVGAYGQPLPTTPTLDALARDGARFDQAFAPASFTLPSQVSLFTGLAPTTHHVLSNTGRKFDSDTTTLAELLQHEGLHTAGYHGGGYVDADFGFAEGFDTYERHEQLDAAIDVTVEFFRSRPDQDAFVFLHTFGIHAPYEASAETIAKLGEDFATLAAQLPAGVDAASLGSTRRLARHYSGAQPFDELELQLLRLLYAAGVRAVDDQLGGLVARLRELGLWDDTLVVVTSDHGEEFMEHGGLLHGHSLHGELLRVPLILSGPRIPVGRLVSEPAGLIDVAPTLLAWLGAPVPASMEGRPLQPMSSDPTNDPTPVSASLLTHGRRQISLVRGDLHYIHDADSGTELLYDLRADALETQDLAATHPDELDAARALARQNVQRLPGLHLVFRADDVDGRLTGTLRMAQGRRPLSRRFFGAPDDRITLDPTSGVLSFDLGAPHGSTWLNLDFGAEDALVEMELAWNAEPLAPELVKLPTADGVVSLSEGRYRFRLHELARTPAALDGPQPGLQLWSTHARHARIDAPDGELLQQLHQLGYLK